MLIEKYGDKNLSELIAHLYTSKIYTDNKKGLDTFNIGDMESKAEDKKTVAEILTTLHALSPMREVDHLTRFEYENAAWILVTVLIQSMDDVPLFINSNFKLVRETALWRLKVNR
jgi:hypothetical protein